MPRSVRHDSDARAPLLEFRLIDVSCTDYLRFGSRLIFGRDGVTSNPHLRQLKVSNSGSVLLDLLASIAIPHIGQFLSGGLR